MPKNLKRITGRGHLHYIVMCDREAVDTFCCYQRRPLLASVRSRKLLVGILAEVRARFGFLLVGYVIMPDHVHLLISESGSVSAATIVQVLKQRVSRRMRGKKRRGSNCLCNFRKMLERCGDSGSADISILTCTGGRKFRKSFFTCTEIR